MIFTIGFVLMFIGALGVTLTQRFDLRVAFAFITLVGLVMFIASPLSLAWRYLP